MGARMDVVAVSGVRLMSAGMGNNGKPMVTLSYTGTNVVSN